MPVGEVVLEHRANHPDPESIQNLVFQRFPDRRRNGDWLEIEVGEVVSFVQALPQLQQKEVR